VLTYADVPAGRELCNEINIWKDRHIEIGIPCGKRFKGLKIRRTRTRECRDLLFSFGTEREYSVSRLLTKGSC
jgi:hypothetical protein